ncbi:hypothetical protein Tco_0586336 [Tanacetum coccineum]
MLALMRFLAWYWLAFYIELTIDCYAARTVDLVVSSPPENFVYHGSSPLKSVKLILLMKALFSDELPGLPPASEILNLALELILGAEPISKAPVCYRSPVELKELRSSYTIGSAIWLSQLRTVTVRQDISKTSFWNRYFHEYLDKKKLMASFMDSIKVEANHQMARDLYGDGALPLTQPDEKGEKFCVDGYHMCRQESFEEFESEIGCMLTDFDSSIRFRSGSLAQIYSDASKERFGCVWIATWEERTLHERSQRSGWIGTSKIIDTKHPVQSGQGAFGCGAMCFEVSGGLWASMRIESTSLIKIKEAQKGRRLSVGMVQNVEDDKLTEVQCRDDSVVWFDDNK